MYFKRFLVTALLISTCAGNTWAQGLKSLEEFVKNVKSGQAEFTQVVTSPARDGQPPRVKNSSGQFAFARPNRFKFIYKKPFEQSIVADGEMLWLFDVDLNQVTVRKQAAVLGSTPAALIAAAPDLRAVSKEFSLSEAPAEGGLEWVLATPRARDSSLQSVRVGFHAGNLARLEILDSFGQKSVLTFSAFDANASLDAAAFQFKPPAGADVIHQ
jgi:outer membrane lipoprotein carrier protein